MCNTESVNFIEFLMDFYIYGDGLDTILITDKMLLHFKLSRLGQILCVDKTGFSSLVTNVKQSYTGSVVLL